MIKVPPYLKQGDTIAIICPSGFMPLDRMQTCIETLQQWDFNVVMGKTAGQQFNYFSGTDEERLDDLQSMLDDNTVQAIYCGRGGYGLSRIIDRINFQKFIEHPKWIIGYSDITLLHTHIFSNLQIATLHAPMAGAFNEMEKNAMYIQSVLDSLSGIKQSYTVTSHPNNRPGICEGQLVGGNLSLLAHVIGSSSDINTKNKILFIEDIGEYKYNIDRMLMQLKRAGKLKELSGLIVGKFTDIKDTTIPFGQDIYELIADKVYEYEYPVCFDFPVGHVPENFALKVGVKFQLKLTDENVNLSEAFDRSITQY
ncbi:MAG: LD-carboxypeptidase [Bacteroidetes bacterium]|nr:LD-carboxypeptidase [Bacteroidota bacterium]